MCIRLCCRCILLSTHRPSDRWIRLRGHRLRSRCIKLCLHWCGEEIWRHTIPSHWIPPFGKSRRISTLRGCGDRRSSRVDRSCCSHRRCSSSLWWRFTVTRFCLAVLSRQSCCHRHLHRDILHLIWPYVTRPHATRERAFCKSLDYGVVHRVAHDCCTLDKCLRHSLTNCIHHLILTLSLCQPLEGWKIKLLDDVTRSGDSV